MIYHWKEKMKSGKVSEEAQYIEDFVAFCSFRTSTRSLLWYVPIVVVLGAIGSWLHGFMMQAGSLLIPKFLLYTGGGLDYISDKFSQASTSEIFEAKDQSLIFDFLALITSVFIVAVFIALVWAVRKLFLWVLASKRVRESCCWMRNVVISFRNLMDRK